MISFILFIITVLIILSIIIIILKKKYKNDNLTSFEENNFYFEIDNALTNEQCDKIINISKDKLIKSKVMSLDKNNNYQDVEDNSVRTSYQTWLNNKEHDDIIKEVEKLVNKFSKNIKVNSDQFENIQVVRYKPTQEYKQHYDICHPISAAKEHLKTCQEDYKKFNSLRYATVLFYLNDDFNGGETYFPRLNKKIIPKKGKALIFFNCNIDNKTINNGLCNTILNSEHSGLPVKNNEKWIANIWIRTKSI